MSFLAPLFWLGAAAVALPVLFHLIRRTTKEQTVFSSLMFLLPSPPRLTRRSRLEHLLLLALRCLILCLLAAGFARPFIKKAMSSTAANGPGKKRLVLLDTSASMRRSDLWNEARQRVQRIASQAGPADEMAVYTFDRALTPLVDFEQWKSTATGDRVGLIKQRLMETSPGWLGTHLGDAVMQAAEMLGDATAQTPPGSREIIVVSDMQEGAGFERLQGYEWPKQIYVSVDALKPKHSGNAGLQLVTDPNVLTQGEQGMIRVRVSNSSDSRREQFKVGWASADGRSFVGKPAEVYVPAGQSRIVPLVSDNAPSSERILLQGDDEDFDNIVFVIAPERSQVRVLYLGSEKEQESQQPLYFLKRALQDTRRQSVQVVAHSAQSPISQTEVESAGMIIVTEKLTPVTAAALRKEVESGKTLLYLIRNEAGGQSLGELMGAERLSVQEAPGKNYAMLAEINFQHPFFAVFSDPKYSDFTKIHFWHHRKVNSEEFEHAQVLARFDNGDPAVMDVALGKGRVVLLTSGWQPEDSQMALSTKFVPFLYAVLDQSGSAPKGAEQYFAGETVALNSLAGGEGEIINPDGKRSPISVGQTNFAQTLIPGVYQVKSKDKQMRFAVNLDGNESRTAPVPVDELERFGAPLVPGQALESRAPGVSQAQLKNAELESRQKLWKWFILGTLVLLLAETWLGGKTSRGLVRKEETAV